MHSTKPDTVADRLSHAVRKVSSSGMGNFQDQGCDRTSAALCLQQSIARFGNRRSQHILKRCEEAFSYTVGERILESFFHDKNTYSSFVFQFGVPTVSWGPMAGSL